MVPEPSLTLAVVDDDDHVRDSLKALLWARGFTVVDFARARDFLDWQQGQAAHCLLLDVHMPGMSGLELLEALRLGRRVCPAVLLTGRSDPSITERARALDVVAVLEKPVLPAALMQAIAQALAPTLS